MTIDVPASIDPTGNEDVSEQLTEFANSAPDGSEIKGRDGAKYRCETGVKLKNKWGLSFTGDVLLFSEQDDWAKPSSDIDPRRKNFAHVTVDRGGDYTWGWRIDGPVPASRRGTYVERFGGQHALRLKGVKGFRVLAQTRISDVYGDFLYAGASGTRAATKVQSENIVVEGGHYHGASRQGMSFIHVNGFRIQGAEFGAIGRSLWDIESNAPVDSVENGLFVENRVTDFVRKNVLACMGKGRRVRNITLLRNLFKVKPFVISVGGNVERSGLYLLENVSEVMAKTSGAPIKISGFDDVVVRGNRVPIQASRKQPLVLLQNQTGYDVRDNDAPGARVQYRWEADKRDPNTQVIEG